MTERDIQAALYDYRSVTAPFPTLIPNVYFYPWESDLLYISKSGYITEYEIKLSRADFHRDFRKSKQWRLSNCTGRRPKYFYYACPEGLIRPEEIPSTAGLFYVRIRDGGTEYSTAPGLCASRIIKAPRARVEPITNREWQALMAKGTERYWNLLRKINQETGYAEKGS